MLILLPPSEGKTSPTRGTPLALDGLSFPDLTGARGEVLDRLVAVCSADRDAAAATLGLGRTQTDEVDRNTALRSAPTARADRVYSGVLYEALDLPSLEGAAKRRATSWVVVMSSLFGAVRPGDRIPAYRLAGNVTLPDLGGVAAYWGRRLDPVLAEAAGRGLVVDLRSSTYAGFWRPGADLSGRVVTVRVLHEVDGVRKVVSHFNKATKGRMVRALITDGGTAGSVRAFTEQLGDLGWTVVPGPKPGVLDVVVREL